MGGDRERDRRGGQVEAAASAPRRGPAVRARCSSRAPPRAAGWSRSPGRSTSHPRRGSRTHAQREAEPARLGAMPAERAGAVAELEARRGWGRTRRWCRRRAGRARASRRSWRAGHARSTASGRSACATTTRSKPMLGERGDAVVDRAVESAARAPHHLGAGASRPRRDLVVVAHDENREEVARRDHAVGHATSQRDARDSALERGSQTHLRVAEALDGHEHGGAHRGESMVSPDADPQGRRRARHPGAGRGRRAGRRVGVRWSVAARLVVIEASAKWRDPSTITSIRHVRSSSTPVFEASVRVTAGDVRQGCVRDLTAGVVAVVEIENDSPLTLAVAFAFEATARRWSRRVPCPRCPARAGTDGPPADAALFPLPHRAVSASRAARGRTGTTGPTGSRPPRRSRPVGRSSPNAASASRHPGPSGQLRVRPGAAAARDWARSGRAAHRHRCSVAALERLRRPPVAEMGPPPSWLPTGAIRSVDPRARAALVEARDLLAAIGDAGVRATSSSSSIGSTSPVARDDDDDSHAAIVATVRNHARATIASEPRTLLVLPGPPARVAMPTSPLIDVPTRWGEVSFAVRWHGARPALLWESTAAAPRHAASTSLDAHVELPSRRARRCSPRSAQPERRDPPRAERGTNLRHRPGRPADRRATRCDGRCRPAPRSESG